MRGGLISSPRYKTCQYVRDSATAGESTSTGTVKTSAGPMSG
jgi:hypothetical protein